jgi:hypothetical protein
MKDPYARTHMKIATEIRKAKRRMLARHRAGENLIAAGNRFLTEVSDVISEQSAHTVNNSKKGSTMNANTQDANPNNHHDQLLSIEVVQRTSKTPHTAEGKTYDRDDLNRRARAIIDDENQPQQTRKAVEYALSRGWKTAEIIERAEHGEDLSWAKTEEIEAMVREGHDQRYGSGFNALSDEALRSITSTVINGSNDAAELMMLLADEFERRAGGDNPANDVWEACLQINYSAAKYQKDVAGVITKVANRRREQFTGSETED